MAATLSEFLDKQSNRTGHCSAQATLTAILTGWDVQSVAISGSPSGGSYTLSFTTVDGTVLTTGALAHNANAAAVQAALRLLAGLESVTVESSGSSPNFTHTVTFVGVLGNQRQLTSSSSLTGGTPAIAHATTVQGTPSLAAAYQNIITQLNSKFSSNAYLAEVAANMAMNDLLNIAERLATEFR